jgi:hypothetical protein
MKASLKAARPRGGVQRHEREEPEAREEIDKVGHDSTLT